MGGFEPWRVANYVVCLCKGCDACVFVCIVWPGPVGARVWEVSVFRHEDVYVLCASCVSFQCCVLHDLQFVDAGRGCKRLPYGRGIIQSQCYECLLLFTTSCCVRVLRCCEGVCCMSKVRPRTFALSWVVQYCLF